MVWNIEMEQTWFSLLCCSNLHCKDGFVGENSIDSFNEI